LSETSISEAIILKWSGNKIFPKQVFSPLLRIVHVNFIWINPERSRQLNFEFESIIAATPAITGRIRLSAIIF